jgi:hypothetical protein
LRMKVTVLLHNCVGNKLSLGDIAKVGYDISAAAGRMSEVRD